MGDLSEYSVDNTGYFDYIEDLIERENTFTMEKFISVNKFWHSDDTKFWKEKLKYWVSRQRKKPKIILRI